MPSAPLRILLINSNRFHDPMPLMPIGLCMVAASLRQAGHTIKVLDLCFSKDPATEVGQAIADFPPDLVGVSIRNIDTCNGFQPRFLVDEVGREVITPLKAAFKGPIVLGGAAAGINSRDMLNHYGLDYAVHGDGELSMREVAHRIAEGTSLADCPGLAIRMGGEVRVNPASYVADLDSLPAASVQDFLDLSEYRAFGSPFSIQSKRGCALTCSYCTYNKIEGCNYRLRSPRLIAWEIAEFVAATDYRRVEFVDSTFNVPIEHAKAVLREIIKLKLNLSLSTMGLHPRFVDEELMDLMKQAGFMDISIGIESGNDITLKGLGKNFSVADIEKAGKLVRRYKIPVMWYLLLGGPGETSATLRQTFRTVGRVVRVMDVVNIGVGLRVYEGSPIAQDLANKGQADQGFFKPYAFLPEGISIPQIKAMASFACLMHHNFLMFDDGANIKAEFAKWFTKTFERQPIWRAYVVGRIIERFTPIWYIRVILAIILRPLRRRALQARHQSAMALDQGL